LYGRNKINENKSNVNPIEQYIAAVRGIRGYPPPKIAISAPIFNRKATGQKESMYTKAREG
jgi:hypothetical protein